MQFKELIQKKRDGGKHTSEELAFLIEQVTAGKVPDYQIAAWLMAVFFRRMQDEELSDFVRFMWHSGKTLPRSHRNDYWVDKHSTGGVGDKTSIILVPLVASVCDRLFGERSVKIPMISGRGLGHLGGTIDKLESVSGFQVNLSMQEASSHLEKNGYVMMGQTLEVAPADRLIYAMRDVTATVECVDLIVASILSKKLSENLDGLVIDLKFGSGAFMPTIEKGRELARALVTQAGRQKVDTIALLTEMNEPLGLAAGHFIEMEECADFVSHSQNQVAYQRDSGLTEVTLALASAMISLASRNKISVSDAKAECEKELTSDRVAFRFRQMLESQGGDWGVFMRTRGQWRKEMETYPIRALDSGFVKAVDARACAFLIGALGGGRSKKDSAIDPLVGMEFSRKVGDRVEKGEVIGTVFYRKTTPQITIVEGLANAVSISESAVTRRSLILETLHN